MYVLLDPLFLNFQENHVSSISSNFIAFPIIKNLEVHRDPIFCPYLLGFYNLIPMIRSWRVHSTSILYIFLFENIIILFRTIFEILVAQCHLSPSITGQKFLISLVSYRSKLRSSIT